MVDTSAVAALVFQESRAPEARQILAGSVLHAPSLLRYELTSVACKKARGNPELLDLLLGQLEEGLALDIKWHEVSHPAVCRLALDTGLSAYDASYLYLSRVLAIPW